MSYKYVTLHKNAVFNIASIENMATELARRIEHTWVMAMPDGENCFIFLQQKKCKKI